MDRAVFFMDWSIRCVHANVAIHYSQLPFNDVREMVESFVSNRQGQLKVHLSAFSNPWNWVHWFDCDVRPNSFIQSRSVPFRSVPFRSISVRVHFIFDAMQLQRAVLDWVVIHCVSHRRVLFWFKLSGDYAPLQPLAYSSFKPTNPLPRVSR